MDYLLQVCVYLFRKHNCNIPVNPSPSVLGALCRGSRVSSYSSLSSEIMKLQDSGVSISFAASLPKYFISNILRRWFEKFSTKPKTDVKLGTSGRWVGTRTGAGVTSTLLLSFFGRSPWLHDIGGSVVVCVVLRCIEEESGI